MGDRRRGRRGVPQALPVIVRGAGAAVVVAAFVACAACAACAAAAPKQRPPAPQGAKAPMTTPYSVDDLLALATTLGQRTADAAPRFGAVTLSMRGTTTIRPSDPRLSSVTLFAAEATDVIHSLFVRAAAADRFPRVSDWKARLGDYEESPRSHYKQPISLLFRVAADPKRGIPAYDLSVVVDGDESAPLDRRPTIEVQIAGPR